MTSQLVLLNQKGVALASDSAVTIGGSKAYNSVQKIFGLEGGQPVGFVIAGNANYIPCDIPWERIIGLFSKDLGTKTFPTLQGYVDAFQKFVESTPSLDKNPENSISLQVDLVSFWEKYLDIAAETQHNLQKAEDSLSISDEVPEFGKFIKKKLSEQIDFYHAQIVSRIDEQDKDEIHQHHRIMKIHSKAAKSAAEWFCVKHKIAKKHKGQIVEMFSYHLAEFNSLNKANGKWRQSTNLAIAGFGEDQLKPQLIDFRVGAIIDPDEGPFAPGDIHSIRVREDLDDLGDLRQIADTRHFTAGAFIVPYAQQSEIQTILNGINNQFTGDAFYWLEIETAARAAAEIHQNLLMEMDQIDGIGPATMGKIASKFGDVAPEISDIISKSVVHAIRSGKKARRGKFRANAEHMSVSQLGAFAKRLVEMEAEITYYSEAVRSVGKPIRVATITKEEGLKLLDIGEDDQVLSVRS